MDIKRSLKLLLSRAVIRRVDDSGAFQEQQVKALGDELREGLERFGDYGFASRPRAGAEAVVASIGGVRSHGIVIAIADRRYRMQLAEGEVAIHDDQGQCVHLARDGIRITGQKLTVTADEATFSGNVTIEGDLLVKGESDLGGTGGIAVKRSDDTPATKVRAE